MSIDDDVTGPICIGDQTNITLVHIEMKRMQRRISEIESELNLIKQTLIKHLSEEVSP